MEETSKEISLSQLWAVFKKAFKRGVIYVLVSVIVIGALLTIVRSIGRKSESVATISIGGEVDDTVLVRLNANKTTAVNDALADFKSGTKTDLSAYVLNNLTIVGLVPNNMPNTPNTVVVPSTFRLTLSNNDDIGLTHDESNELLTLISKSLLNLWNKKSLNSIDFSIDIEREMELKEFYQIINSLDSKVNLVASSITNNINTISQNLKTENEAFKEVLVDLNTMKERVSALRTYVAFNVVENTYKINGGNLKQYYDDEYDRLKREHEAVEAKYTNVNALITAYVEKIPAKIKVTEGAGGTIVYNYDDTTIVELEKVRREYDNQRQNLDVRMKEVDYYRTKIVAGKSQEQMDKESEYVKSELMTIVDHVNDSMAKYNTTMNEVEEVAYSYSGSAIKVPSKTVYTDTISLKVMAVVLVLVALIAYFVAYVQTYSKLKKSGFLELESNSKVEKQ